MDQEGKIREIGERLQRAEGSFALQGGALARNRDHLIQQEGTLKERISQLEETVRHHCAGLLPFALAPELCERLRDQLLLEEKSAEAKAGQTVLLSAKKELMDRLNPSVLLSDLDDISDATRTQVHQRIARALQEPLRAEQLQPVDTIHEVSDATSGLLLAWIQQATTDVPQTLKAVTLELENAHRELHKTAESLRAIPADDALRPILEDMRNLNEKLARASGEAMLKDQLIKELELQLAEGERRHAHLVEKLSAAAKNSGRLIMLPRVQNALEEYRLKLIEKKITELQGAVTECFNLLCRKKDSLRTINIDPRDFSITLRDRNQRPLPKAELSAGEKQIYAISMLWALGRTSGRPLPIVIDTPLARLDSDHRRLLVEHYFPHASHQVIVLSTDTEVDQMYFDLLKPTIARAHHLDYDQVESSTVIKQGYFWREPDEAYKVAAN